MTPNRQRFSFVPAAAKTLRTMSQKERIRFASDLVRSLPPQEQVIGLSEQVHYIELTGSGKRTYVAVQLLHRDLWLIIAIHSQSDTNK